MRLPTNLSRVRVALLVAIAVSAMGGSAALAQGRRTPVKWTATVTPPTAHPGEIVAVAVTGAIQPDYHIYSVEAVPPPGPVATTIEVTGNGLTAEGQPSESAPKRIHDPNFNKDLALHEGTATFTRYLRVGASAAPAASVPLTISLRYQACTSSFCLPPKTVVVTAPPLAIGAGAVRAEYATPPAPAVGATAAAAPASGAPLGLLVADGGSTDGSLGAFLAAAFGAGLLALLTPCVFPLIPVTLAFFTKQVASSEKGERAGSIVPLASLYCLGIVLAFTGIGAVLAATVGAAGANRFASSPWTNLVFAALFFLFAFALLEVIDLRPPAFLQKRASARTGGALGVLGMGLTFVVAAFTCTAPFIGTVLVAAASATTGAQWLRPILGMLVFSTALALPFFLLALFPGLLARLPRSGAWLTTLKGSMGFLELAAALKFLSNTDLVWQWKLLTQPILLALWMVIGLAGAAWLLGALRIGFNTPDGPPTAGRRIGAGLFAAAALYCLWGLTGRPLNDWVVAFLPPIGYGYASAGTTETASADEPSYLSSLDSALAQAKAENKPVFVDFTGYTCTNCRWMEKNVFTHAEVKSELDQFVRVQLYTDGGADADKNQTYQEKTFGDVALPLYAVLQPDGTPVARSAGITRDPARFAEFLRKGRTRTVAANGT